MMANISIFDGIVIPIVLYGCEVWAKEKKKSLKGGGCVGNFITEDNKWC